MLQTMTLQCLAIAALLAFTNGNDLQNTTNSSASALGDPQGGSGNSSGSGSGSGSGNGSGMNGTMLGLKVSDKFSATSLFSNKTCNGTPFGVMYSNVGVNNTQDGQCEASTSNEFSMKDTFGATDVFTDAMKRFGCNTSFVLIGVGENCQVGINILGVNATSWIALQTDGICHQDWAKTSNKNGSNETTTSAKVELKDDKLKITHYKDENCQQEVDDTKIEAKSQRVGNYFCEDGGLYQIYDASGKSTLFNSTVTQANCKNNVPGAANNTSSASMHGVGLLTSVVGLAATALMTL